MPRGQQYVVSMLVALGAGAWSCLAQPLPAPASSSLVARSAAPGALDDLVALLSVPDLKIREDATDAIQNNGAITLDQIEDVLFNRTLDAEQRQRLERIGVDRFALTPRAALGVTFDPRPETFNEGVPVQGTSDNFDAKRVLLAGDIIHSMTDVRVHSFEDARRVITSHDPGERMTLKIFRRGEPLIVRVTLGNYEDLEKTRGQSRPRAVLRDAWRLRAARRLSSAVALAERPTLDPGLSPHDYLTWESRLQLAEESRAERVAALSVQPDGSTNPASAADQGEPPNVVAGGGGHVVDGSATMDFSSTLRTPRGSAQMNSLQRENMMLSQKFQRLQRELSNLQRPEADRGRLLAEMAGVRQQLQLNEMRIKQMKTTRFPGVVEP